jgi:hypothetical protein
VFFMAPRALGGRLLRFYPACVSRDNRRRGNDAKNQGRVSFQRRTALLTESRYCTTIFS